MQAQIDDGEVLDRVVTALRSGLGDRLWAIVLFGSRARGEHRPESDWDLLVIAVGLPEARLERYQELKSMLPPGTRGSTAVLATTPAEFEARLPELYLDVALDGRILYDRSGYAAGRLAELQRLIDKAGLYRERSPHGHVWKWRVPPSGPWSIEWEQ
jgi:predicted nucleotidyltransferase